MLSRLRDKAWVGYRAGVERLPERLAVETLLRVMPRHFDIEATNLCNHHCPLCPNPVQTRPRATRSISSACTSPPTPPNTLKAL